VKPELAAGARQTPTIVPTVVGNAYTDAGEPALPALPW